MKGFAETVLGVLVMILAVVAVYEFTLVRSLKEQVKAKDLVIDAATLRNRNLQEEMIEKDKTIKLLASPDTLLIR
jgi:predicted Holliday junction resolvase-like endonuclease